MNHYFDNSKTLDELEGTIWDKPEFNSHLVQTCYKLRHTPLHLFEVEDLRIMIGQNIGLLYLIPLAIEALEMNTLAAGDYYAGDLLKAVLDSEPEFRRENPELKKKIEDIVTNTMSDLQSKLQKFKYITGS
jgi:hypothetical protein